MDALPLTPNGKIDRKALPASDEDASTAPGRAPSTVTETTLLSLWSELLGRPIADVDADFFAVGGHSLLAARLAARIEGTFGTTVPVGDLFEEPTVAAFAASLDARLADAPPALAKLRPRDADAVPRLSYAQYRQWALARLDPENAAYHIPAAIRLNRPIAPDVLEHALAFVIARHEVLRAGFVDEEGVPRVLLESTPAPSVRHVPLPDAEAKRDEADVLALLRDDVTRPFDLARPPLLRATIVDVGEDEQVVLLVLHHIVGDAWSLRILFTELMQICRRAALGLAPKLPAPPLGYFDFAAWEHERDDEASLAYWREQLRDLPPVLDLPLDRPRPQIQDTTAGEVRFALSAHARARLESTCRAQGATLFMGLLAGWNALLHRWSGVDDVTIGCPIGHRPHADLDEVVGLFVNTLAIRTRIRPEASFASLVGDVRETVLDGMAHQDAPFDQVVGELELPRSFAHAPVFQVLFVWQETEADANPATRGAWSPLPLPVASTKVDLTLAMSPDADGGLRARIEFRRDLFHAKTLERLASAFVALLEGAAEAPETPIEALSTQSHAGREELARWNPRYVPVVREGGMLGPFEARAARTPDATALIAPDATLSYGELDARANALAHRLEAAGIGRGQRVGVCMQRTSTLIVAILGALKAGATYVPLDPDYPRERMEYVIRDAELAAFIGEPDRIPADVAASAAAPLAIDGARLDAVRAERVETDVAPDDLAYIIYTSGSTGQPKGVAIEHASALALVDWAEAEYPAERLAGVLAGTSVCFDLSIFEIFVPLSLGGTIVLAENALALPELAARDRVTLVNTVPTAAAELVRSEGIPPGVTTINVAGEPLTSELVRALYDRPGVDRVYNLYGPSEDTTYSTGALLDYDEEAAFAVIGRPLPNTQAFVLDERFEPVAPGFVGDLFLAGDGVARGYWNRPGLTAERFLPTPFVDAEASSPRLGRMYATGDRVRLRHDGELLFLGRTDNQVKVRGFRIELGEIEATLARHPQVASAALRVHEYEGTGAARKRLVAYVTVEGEASGRVSGGALPPSDPFAETLRTHVGQSLPHYMMPATIVVLDALPQLPNGKVDYRALERPALPRDEGLPEAETRTATEAMLAELWQTVLGVDVVGRHDNFFMLGGDSIVALQLVARVRQRGFGMMPRDLFTSPSVAELAATLDAKAEDAVLASAQIEEGVVPLTPIQHWFFSLPLDHAAHWNQGVLLEVDRPIEATALEAALGALAERHDALRSTFRRDESGWQREIARPGGPVPVTQVRATSDDVEAVIQTKAAEIQARFDLTQGPLWEVASFVLTPTGGGATVRRLLVLCHHLLVDGVSWRILLGDLQLALVQQAEGRPIELAPPSTPASTWAAFLEDWEAGAEDEAHWAALARRAPPPLPRDPEEQAPPPLPRDAEEHATAPLPGDAEEHATATRATHDNALRDGAIHSLTFDAETTDQLLRALPKAYAADLETLALAALARALHAWHGRATVPVLMEGHGRVDLDPGIDLSRTVGWLTSLHPVEIEVDATDPGRALKLVKSATKSIAHQGLGYTRRHFLGEPFAPAPHELAEVRFNYLGQTDQVFAPGTWFAPAPEAIGALRHPEDPRDAVLDVNAIVRRGCLVIHLGYGRHLHRRETIEALGSRLREELLALLAYCLGDEHDGGYVEADFPQMEFAPGELDDLLDALD
ncbi:MAG: amino acid adenylation domain-containing protein [Myxococcota bacterium]